MNPATNILDAIRICAPDEPLKPGDERWQDFSSVRGGLALEKRVARRLESYTSGGEYVYMAVAGHRGCGKSTELYRVKKWAEDSGYLAIYTRVNEELDPFDVDYPDLLLLISRAVEAEFRRLDWTLDRKTLKSVSDWFKSVTKIEEEEVEASLGVETKAEFGPTVPFFAKLMVALTSRVRAGGTTKTEVRDVIRRYPKALVDNVNLLMDVAHRTLEKEGRKGLLLVFDNLDRYQPDVADRLLLQSADILKGVHCNVIYTVPISLIYNPRGDSVEERFMTDTLPMIKVQRRDGDLHEEGVDCMLRALARRVVIGRVFDGEETARELVWNSGGCIRDLMHLCQEAFLGAPGEIVNAEDAGRAVETVRSEFSRRIKTHQYPLLARVHLSKSVTSDPDHRELLYRRDVLEYNYGEQRWADVHPVVRGVREFHNALAREEEQEGGVVSSE